MTMSYESIKSPARSPHITAKGAETLRKELNRLWKQERPEVTQVVHEAAKNGDRSENGDYIYGKRRLREIDRRIRYLTGRLDTSIIVKEPPVDCSKIFFAAWVRVEDTQGNEYEYRLVGSDEIDPENNWISIDSPTAQNLLGKKVGDQVEVKTPSGIRILSIINIRY